MEINLVKRDNIGCMKDINSLRKLDDILLISGAWDSGAVGKLLLVGVAWAYVFVRDGGWLGKVW